MSGQIILSWSSLFSYIMEKKRKKILISCDSPRSLLDFRGKLIEELTLNHEVAVFTPKIEQEQIRRTLTRLGVQVYENTLQASNVSIWSDLGYIYQLYRLIRNIRPDVFFPYTFKPVIYGAMVANFCRVKSITPMLTGLGYNFPETRSKTTLVQKITRILLKFSMKANERTKIIFQNKDDYQTLLKRRVITEKNQAYIVNGSGVDLDHYAYSKPNLDQISFLMISRLINAKGINEYYQSAWILKEKFPNVVFRLIGPFEDNIDAIDQELYSKIKLDGTIEYLGLVTDVRTYIAQSSVVVLPSYYGEGVPRCLLEAMAMGRTLITCNSVGCRETIHPDHAQANGFLVPVKNVKELTAHMQHCIEHPVELIRFGWNGRKYAREKFDVHVVNRQMLGILEGS